MNVPVLTLGAAARLLGVATWQLRRLFERGLLPPAPRVGVYRIIVVEDLPLIERALRNAGYLPPVQSETDNAEEES